MRNLETCAITKAQQNNNIAANCTTLIFSTN